MYLLKRRNIGINVDINFTNVDLGLLLLFLCNLGSTYGHFIRFCGSLFVLCWFPTLCQTRQITVCSIQSRFMANRCAVLSRERDL